MGSFMKTFHRHIWIVLSQIYHHRGRTSYVFSMTDHLGNRLDCRGIWWIRHRVTHSQALSNLCLQSKRRRKNLTNWEILCCKNRIIDNAGRSKNVRNFGGKEILESKMYTALHILVDFAKIDLVYLAIKKCQGWEKHIHTSALRSFRFLWVTRRYNLSLLKGKFMIYRLCLNNLTHSCLAHMRSPWPFYYVLPLNWRSQAAGRQRWRCWCPDGSRARWRSILKDRYPLELEFKAWHLNLK